MPETGKNFLVFKVCFYLDCDQRLPLVWCVDFLDSWSGLAVNTFRFVIKKRFLKTYSNSRQKSTKPKTKHYDEKIVNLTEKMCHKYDSKIYLFKNSICSFHKLSIFYQSNTVSWLKNKIFLKTKFFLLLFLLTVF